MLRDLAPESSLEGMKLPHWRGNLLGKAFDEILMEWRGNYLTF